MLASLIFFQHFRKIISLQCGQSLLKLPNINASTPHPPNSGPIRKNFRPQKFYNQHGRSSLPPSTCFVHFWNMRANFVSGTTLLYVFPEHAGMNWKVQDWKHCQNNQAQLHIKVDSTISSKLLKLSVTFFSALPLACIGKEVCWPARDNLDSLPLQLCFSPQLMNSYNNSDLK